MSRQWTAAQSAAMNTTDKTLLVSAAAGSGKTATLTQRIINRLTDREHPADLSTMLIVTFTHAAADELKSRIFSALGEELAKNPSDRHLTEQLIKLGSARICTIDAFYLELIRSHFSTLGLSPSFRIADPAELELLSVSVMEETIEHFYEHDDMFPLLVEALTDTRQTNRLGEQLLRLSGKLSTLPQGVEFLHTCALRTQQAAEAEQDFLATDFGVLLRDEIHDTFSHYLSVFTAAAEYAEEATPTVLPSYLYDRDFCRGVCDALCHPTEGYLRTRALLEHHEPIKLKPLKDAATETSEMYKSLRTKINKSIREKIKPAFAKDAQTILRAMKDTAGYTDTLYRVMTSYEAAMAEEKARRCILDFNDIRRQTLRLLVEADGSPTQIAKQYAAEFSEIYIDEYQDVDPIQDLIFRSIAKPDNRFMVGDIKQSIYGFRGAEPSLFAAYRQAFPDIDRAEGHPCATIFMSENFRCDQTVIRFTNLVCGRIFSASGGTIAYRPEDDLRFAKKPPSEDYSAPLVEVTVLTPSENKEESGEDTSDNKEREAAYLAAKIEGLIQTGRKADGTPIRPGDIAVLFRARTMSPYLTRALNARGILTSESDGERYFESPDVLMVLCLLNTIDNPHRDIFLSGALRSPLFGFTMDDLIAIRRSTDARYSLYDALLALKDGDSDLARKCRAFDDTLNQYRSLSMSLSVDRFLRILFESDLFVNTGFVTPQSESGEGGNLLRLYEYARTFESGSFKGLYNFIEFINTLIEEGKKLKVPPKGISPDRVNLMTVHQSKGLEFPVCFLCNTGSRFNDKDQQAPLLFFYPTGLALKIPDATGFARINTPMRDALARGISLRNHEEEMRVLYVALTRARERLYLTGYRSGTEASIMEDMAQKARFCTRHTVLSCRSYLDWILLPFTDPKHTADCATLHFLSPEDEASIMEQSPSLKEAPTEHRAEVDPILAQTLRQKYAFRYPYAHLRRIPAKLSVSRLSPDILDEHDTSADLFGEQTVSSVPDFFLGKEPTASAAERGTATHLFLQFCDFDRAAKIGAKEELARLTEKQFIPENLAKLVYLDELDVFLQSEFCREILRARRVIREQRFNLLMSPESFTEDPILREELKDEKLAVQGVIDLILLDENGDLSLFDYKTDRLNRAEQADHALAEAKMNALHGRQLSYYAHAAEQIFGRRCRRLCVYSTCTGELYDITPQPPALPQEILDTL